MSDLRTKLLGLAGVTMLFAGMSYGQVSCTGPVNGAASVTTNVSPLLLRSEGETELTSDLIVQCSGSTAVVNGQVSVFSSLPVTSKVIPNLAPANSEVVLNVWNSVCNPIITNPLPANPCPAPTSTSLGTVSGSTVTFQNVGLAAAFTLEVSNVRVNASTAGAASTPIPATESIFIGTNGVASVAFNNVTTGYVLKSLATPAFTLNAFGFPAITNYTVCQGNAVIPNISTFEPTPSVVGGNISSFTVTVGEAFGGAFKVQAVTPATTGLIPTTSLANEEEGSFIGGGATGLPAAVGTAASGTEISLTLGNVPSSATIYAPIQIISGNLTLTLTGNPTAVTTPQTLVNSINAQAAIYPLGVTTATPSNGTAVLTYQVTATNATGIETANVPVAVTFGANTASSQGAITVLEAYAPSAALTGQASSVPTFAVPTNTPLNGSLISLCQTTLMFPYVTNQSGFETGIAIANTTTDNLGFGGKSVATPTPGACTINFYGNQAQPTAFTTPTIGAWSSSTGTQSPVYAATLTTMSGASNFSGYAIALCPFLEAHGFAFIEDGLGTSNGVAEGYVAVVVPNARGEALGTGE